MFTWLKSHKLILVLIVALLIFFGYRYHASRQITYSEYVVASQNLNDTLELSGKIKAISSATLRFPAGGLVTYLGAKEGEPVKKWQTLASIDTRQLQKTLEQKLNLYVIQRGTFDQTIDDNDNSVPGGDLARTLDRLLAKNQYQLDNTVKDVEYLDLSLQLSRLSSPIAGILVQAPISTPNVQVLASDAWIVVDPATLYFSADLDETDLSRISLGQKVLLNLDAYPDKQIESTISTLAYSPKETSTGTTYEIKILLSGDDAKYLRLGLNGTAQIILSEHQGVPTLSLSALHTKNGESFTYIKDGNKYTEQLVQTGIESSGTAEILSGLGVGDHVYAQK